MYKRVICAYCGKEFIAEAPGQKYCSIKCKEENQKIRQRKYGKTRKAKGKDKSPKAKPGDICSKCGYNIHYVLEYSHEVYDFLCANCHRTFHPGSRGRLSDAMVNGLPVKIFGALYDPGFPYDPERCYMCKCSINSTIWEKHHMVEREYGGKELGNENIVIICANCHRILHRNANALSSIFEEFLNSKEPYYRSSHTNQIEYYMKLSSVMQLEIMKRFYYFLRDNWEEIIRRIRYS